MTRVLVVDDDHAVRAALATTLSDMGLSVSEAKGGEEALAKAQAEIPDMILLDVDMPGLDGFQVLQKLRERAATESTPVVMLTGLPVVEGEACSMALGSTHYIIKPWNLDILEVTVKVAIHEGIATASEDDESDSKPQVIRTGGKLSALEAMMDGGLPLNTLTLIEGASSTGKSVFCQHLTYGALADGHDTAYFTSDHTAQSLVIQMESIGLEVYEYRPDKLQIYPLPEREESGSPESLLSLVAKNFLKLPPKCEFIVVDAITALAAPCPEQAVIDFFISCKRLCAQGKTVALSVDSYAFSNEMFARLSSMCDSYLSLGSEKVGKKGVRTLEVRKVDNIELSRDNMISFLVDPNTGMRIIPYSRTRALN